MTPYEIAALVLGSAVVAALISGVFARSTTRALIEDQRAERREASEVAQRKHARALIAGESEAFIRHYVLDGLELVAAQLDRASHQIDLSFRRAKRLRALTRAARNAIDDEGTFKELIEIRGILDPPVADPIHVNQSSMIVFPGDFMQAGLLLNRSIALADDFVQRYPWTQDDRVPRVERFLDELKTVLAASARRFEAAAAVVRQMDTRRSVEWSSATIGDERLKSLGADLIAMTDGLLSHEPKESAS